MSDKLRVLVVDDTVVYRKIVKDILDEIPDVEVVGTAHNGKAAMSRINNLKPDLLTLDIEMPEMNGIEVLQQVREQNLNVGAIMLSTLTHEGGDLTMQALDLGAFDFIPKPQEDTIDANTKAVRDALVPMLAAFRRMRDVRLRPAVSPPVKQAETVVPRRSKSEIIGIGISTGGPNALAQMIPALPHNINVPILVVQHMPPIFTQSLANSLNAKTELTVHEAADGQVLSPNTIYIAPGGTQMKIEAASDGRNRIIKITDDPPENSCKPSVDYLFRSIAHHYVGRATGVIMTGMGSDGTIGMRLLKRGGAITIAQDEASCVVFGMPKEAINSGAVDHILPLECIASEIARSVR